MLAFQGDILSLRVFDQVVVVLCSSPAIKDLLEKRGEIYSDRPPLPILEMCARGVVISDHIHNVGTPEPIGIGP